MKYTELTVHTSTEGSELVADVMWNYTTHGVTVCDVNDIISLQRDSTVYWDYMDESLIEPKKTDVLVKCFLSMESADETARRIMRDIGDRKELSAGEIDFGTLESIKRVIEGDDWIDVWKKHFRPLHIGARVVIVPEWIEYKKQTDEIIVTLDSNMAFGTGEHETTSMCLELLQDYVKEDCVCIDVGCGSGILGIAAAKLGAKTCYLTDIDTIAVESAKHNCIKNGVSERVVVAHSNLLDNAEIKGDVVFANITAEVLTLLAPSIPKNMKRDGALILSGIIESRLELVKKTYGAMGLRVVKQCRKGEWFALVLTF